MESGHFVGYMLPDLDITTAGKRIGMIVQHDRLGLIMLCEGVYGAELCALFQETYTSAAIEEVALPEIHRRWDLCFRICISDEDRIMLTLRHGR